MKQENSKEVLLRGERAGDHSDVDTVTASAFGGDTEAKLINELRKTRNYIKGLSIVAVLEGKLIGHAMLTHAYIINRGRRFNCLALGPMAVQPEFQRKGFGTKLAEEVILRAKECGFKAVVVIGDSAYYSKFGFIPASTKKIRSRFNTPDENFMVLELIPNGLKGIVGLAEYAKEFRVFLKDEPKKTETVEEPKNTDTVDEPVKQDVIEEPKNLEDMPLDTQTGEQKESGENKEV